ncbi:MAG: MlaD family protein [Candidatus Dormibacteria bacterium]
MKVSRSLVAGIAVAVALVGGFGVTLASGKLFSSPTHQVEITFPTADGLVSGSDVLENGAKIGTISDIEPTDTNSALVTLEIENSHWPLHAGVTADIRPKSLLGEKYVDLHDGTSAAQLDASQVLHETQQAVPVELDQFINSLDAPTREAARVLLDDLGAGVAGRGQDLNAAIAAGKQDLQNLATFGTTLNNRDPDLDRILVGLDGVLSKITTNDQLTQLSQLITNGQQTLNAIETQQAAFSRQFSDAQTALSELNTAIDTAVPSLTATLNIGPQLLTATQQESTLLAFLAAHGSTPQVLDLLNQGLLQGPTTTGGALETTIDPATGKTVTEPIFRVCLVAPYNASGSSCQGTGFHNQGSATVSGYSGSGMADAALLAAFLGD